MFIAAVFITVKTWKQLKYPSTDKWIKKLWCIYLQWNAVVVFQSLSHVWLFVTPWTIAHKTPLSSTIYRSLLKFMSIESVMLSNHLILCCPLLLLSSIFPSIRVLSNELTLASCGQSIRASASTTVLPMHIQGCFPLELTSLISLQSKELSRVFFITTILKYQFFRTQPSLWFSSHISTWLLEKPVLTIWAFVGKMMSQLSRFVIAFLPRSKRLLISFNSSQCPQWFWSPRKENLNCLHTATLLLAMKKWDWMPWS